MRIAESFYLQTLDRVDLSDRDLSGTYFRMATLKEVDFSRSDLRNADFTGISLEDLLSCTFTKARLDGVVVDPSVAKDDRWLKILGRTTALKKFIITATRSESFEVYAVNAREAMYNSAEFDRSDWDDYEVEEAA